MQEKAKGGSGVVSPFFAEMTAVVENAVQGLAYSKRDLEEEDTAEADALNESIVTIDFSSPAPMRGMGMDMGSHALHDQDPDLGGHGSTFIESTTVTMDHGGRSSVFGASFNFVNSIIGAGIIGIPFALELCGFYFGIAMLILVAYLVDQSVIMLISCGVEKNKYDFEELTQHLLGDYGYYATTAFMFIFAYGAQVAYMVIIGDTIPIVLRNAYGDEGNLPSREFIMSMFSIFIILPLCLLKHLSSLAKTSSLSVLSDCILVLIIISNSFREGDRQGIDTGVSGSSIISPTIFAGIGTISFAFVCQHNSFLVFKSLKEPTLENWRSVAHISVGVSLSLSLLLGIMGYLSFKETTHGDILTNFPDTNRSINAARVLLAMCMTFVYPMECYVSRHCICSIIDKMRDKKAKASNKANDFFGNIEFVFSALNDQSTSSSSSSSVRLGSQPSPTESTEVYSLDALTKIKCEDNNIIRTSVSLLLWGSSLLIAIASGNLGIVLALTGALAASFLGFVIPGVLYLKTYEGDVRRKLEAFKVGSSTYEPDFSLRLASMQDYYLPAFMIVFGGVLCILGVSTVLSGADGE